MFLIPEAPSIQGNTLCGKGSDPSEGYNPTDPTPAVPACAGCQGTPQQRAPYTSGGGWARQAKHTEQERGMGNQSVNIIILFPLTLTLF